jgi:hypothetical protein
MDEDFFHRLPLPPDIGGSAGVGFCFLGPALAAVAICVGVIPSGSEYDYHFADILLVGAVTGAVATSAVHSYEMSRWRKRMLATRGALTEQLHELQGADPGPDGLRKVAHVAGLQSTKERIAAVDKRLRDAG